MGNAPVKRINDGNIQCSVFENEYKGRKTHSYKFQKRYMTKDETGKEIWKTAEGFYKSDLGKLRNLIDAILHSFVKFQTVESTKPQSEPEPESQEQPEDLPF